MPRTTYPFGRVCSFPAISEYTPHILINTIYANFTDGCINTLKRFKTYCLNLNNREFMYQTQTIQNLEYTSKVKLVRARVIRYHCKGSTDVELDFDFTKKQYLIHIPQKVMTELEYNTFDLLLRKLTKDKTYWQNFQEQQRLLKILNEYKLSDIHKVRHSQGKKHSVMAFNRK
ncbi:hypothetical protein T10_6458 [Trichinella papuae]|uniref:Uncharacterized protein n=1 Tax=Trichinella papuae TaxID=268474 RepID=A0A0V1N0W4_9BILA|nr:hypothetical protein T10_6458 [Trichinella papuae]